MNFLARFLSFDSWKTAVSAPKRCHNPIQWKWITIPIKVCSVDRKIVARNTVLSHLKHTIIVKLWRLGIGYEQLR